MTFNRVFWYTTATSSSRNNRNAMHAPTSIHRVDQLLAGSTIALPPLPGVYAFWWIAPREKLKAANRQVVLLGPGQTPVNVEYRD